MTESQNSSVIDSHEKQVKGHRWLNIILVLGAITLIFALILLALFQNHAQHYSPANFAFELEQNQVKWDRKHITHYKMVINEAGYSINDQMPWIIEVQNDKVISAINAQGKSVLANDSANRFTITALFKDIKEKYQWRAPEMQVSYNPTYGYPENIYIDPYSEPCCQDYEIEVKDFQILP